VSTRTGKRCWAAPLGGCSHELSREHLISDSLWTGDGIDVLGFDWCKNETKRVGRNAVTAHILCRTHNSALSPLDVEAKYAFRALSDATVLVNERRGVRPRKWKVRRFEVARPDLLERWFLKTMINLLVVKPGPTVWRSTGETADKVPLPLVRMAFGEPPITRPMGLYISAALNENVALREIVAFAPLEYGEPDKVGIIGGLFEFRGFRLILHLEPHELPPSLTIPAGGETVTRQLLYHATRINFNVGKQLSHYLQFCWHLTPSRS